MTGIQKRENPFPSRNNLNFKEILFQNYNDSFDSVELIISIDDKQINIKEFSAYLDFIYQTDGYLSEYGLLSYSKMPRVQLEISGLKKGSLLLIIEKLINGLDGQNLIVLYLVLKYLPNVIKVSIDSAKTYYTTLSVREDYLEKKEKRKFRNPLKKAIFSDIELNSMTDKQKEKLAEQLSKFYRKNNLAASRFAQKFIKKIKLKPHKKKK